MNSNFLSTSICQQSIPEIYVISSPYRDINYEGEDKENISPIDNSCSTMITKTPLKSINHDQTWKSIERTPLSDISQYFHSKTKVNFIII